MLGTHSHKSERHTHMYVTHVPVHAHSQMEEEMAEAATAVI